MKDDEQFLCQFDLVKYYGDKEIYGKMSGPEEGTDGKDCSYEALCSAEVFVAVHTSIAPIGEKDDGAEQVTGRSQEVCNCQKHQYSSGDSTHIFPQQKGKDDKKAPNHGCY